MPETKTCPDCAESVLAAARVCRYCGYRFGEPAPGAGRSLMERLGVTRRRRAPNLEEILADWGFAAQPGETVRCFRYVVVDDQDGYLLVSDRRLMFIADLRRRQKPVFECVLSVIESVTLSANGRRLTIAGPGAKHRITGTGHVVRPIAKAIAEGSGRPLSNDR